jgi:predicted Zn-dependent peptidase
MSILSSETRTIQLVKADLIEIVYYDHAHLTKETVLHDIVLFDELVGRKRVKKLVIIGKHTKIDLDARKQAAEENRRRKNRIRAEAIVVTSTAMRIAIQMYMLFLNQEYPVKLFSTRENALVWLETNG